MDIVRLLLDAGACRSIHNRRYSLTPFDETNETIQKLFYRVNTMTYSTADVAIDHFTGISVNNEWIINLYQWLQIEQLFEQMTAFLQQPYLTDYVIPLCQMKRDRNMIEWFFRQAVNQNDVRYLVKAYTYPTQFFYVSFDMIVMNDIQIYLVKINGLSRFDFHPSPSI